MSSDPSADALKTLSPSKIILPILLGLGVVIYMVFKDYDATTFSSINWGFNTLLWLGVAALLMNLRHFALMYRIRRLTDNQLSWWQSFDVITLWEFGSAVTPSTVGGTAVALFLLTREKIQAGQTISIILFIVFLDTFFFMLSIPLLWLFIGSNMLWPEAISGGAFIRSLFVGGYLFMFSYLLAIGYGLFINPNGFKWLIVKFCQLPFFNRWQDSALQTGNDMVIAAGELKTKGWDYWIAGITSTVFIWVTRFLVLNFVILAFLAVSDHIVLFSRQLVLYVLMLLPITPGGSGLAEGVFPQLFGDFFITASNAADTGKVTVNKGLAAFVVFIWRLISYYAYLVFGFIVLPMWFRRIFRKK